MKKQFDTNKTYHSHDSISASGLKTIAMSSVYDFINQEYKETDAMKRGTAIHEAILEPDVFEKNYYKMPKIDGRTKEGKARKNSILSKAGNKIILDEVDYNLVIKLRDKVFKNELAKYYCTGIVEQSHYFDYLGVKCRCRPDCFDPIEGWISDIKTIREIKNYSIQNEINSRYYDLQAYAYSTWLNIPIESFRFIFVETNKPHKIEVIALNKFEIQRGKKRFDIALSRWNFYKETGVLIGVEPVDYAPDGAKIL
jgi:exodeoxyribonuclease VIII